MTTREYAIQCIKDEAHALLELIPKLDNNFDDAVELMFRCHGKVIAVSYTHLTLPTICSV